jgi:integrase
MTKKKDNLLMRTKCPSGYLEGHIFQTETDFETARAQNLISTSTSEAIFMEKSAQFPYKLAVLNDCNGDPTKRWCITFYVWHTEKNALVRKQLWISLKFKTKAQKVAEADRKIKQINSLLAKGYHVGKTTPAPAQQMPKPENWTVIQAIDWVRERKEPSIRKRSQQSFQLFRTELQRWLELNGMAKLPLFLLRSDHLDQYLHWIRIERKVGNTTYNNYLEFIRITFNYLVKQGKIDRSPAASLQRLKQEEPTNVAFPEDVKLKLLEKYQSDSPELAIFAKYIYYSFIRPKELRMLRVSNVLDKTIFIPGSIAKNRKSEHVLISPALERLIGSLGVRQAPAHWYLIGHDGRPSERSVSTNFFTMRHLSIRQALGLPDVYTLYCWKHTGVTDTYRQTLDIEFVSRQCRHSSLDMTKKYLRGLGLLRDYPLQAQLPDLG